MAEEIAALSIRLEANLARFENELDRVRRTTDRQAGRMEKRVNRLDQRMASFGSRFGKNLLAAGAGFLTVQGFRRLSDAIQGTVDKLDDIAKTADSIGVTTDALQEMRVAADLSGVSIEKFDTSLARFARVASDARDGLAEAERAFERVGVEVTNADGSLKSIDVLLGEVADGFGEMTDATSRAATAQELFGRGGTLMVNLLSQGSDAIEEMRAQARELGIVFDESLIRRSVEVKDELNLMNRQIEASTTVMLAELAPALRDITGLTFFMCFGACFSGCRFRAMIRRRQGSGDGFRAGCL